MSHLSTSSVEAPEDSGYLFRIISLVLLATVSAGVYAYPYARIELGIGLALVFALGVWRPWLLLMMVPIWLVLVNLAPWSGSLYLEDYDLLMGVTLAAFLAGNAYRLKGALSPLQVLAVFLFSISIVAGLYRGLMPVPPWNPIEISTYYSRWNALRIAKGFLWALLMLPGLSFLFNVHKEKARTSIIWGLALAGGIAGVIAMWERGVFHAIASSGSLYAILGSLLDFTTPYRITALFSEMHTGGEAIDGFMALTWPFALLALAVARSRTGVIMASATLILALYAVVTTFSRASYVALASGLIAGGMMAFISWRGKFAGRSGGMIRLIPVFMVPFVLIYLQSRGGIVSLGAALGAWAVGLMAGYWSRSGKRAFWLGALVALFMAAVYVIAHGMLTSKWVHNGPEIAWSLSIGMAALAIAGGFVSGTSLYGIVKAKMLALLVVLLAGGITVVAPALMGTRMTVRLSTDREDADTRFIHWKHTLAIMNRDWATKLIGMGSGRFPEDYLFAYSSRHGNYGFREESGKTILRLEGGEDLTFSQRVSLPAWQKYTLHLEARTPNKQADLRIRVCRRPILVPYDWNPECVSMMKHLKDTENTWQDIDWVFPIGALGDGASFGRRPLTLELMNNEYRGDSRPATLVEIRSVSLRDEQGREKIVNGDFSRGLERWFPYFDFEHMPWHIKNLWVNLYFDQGMLGIAGFIAFLWASVSAAIRLAMRHDTWGVAIVAVAASYMSVGVVGGLVDVPRVILVFYLICLATMIQWKANLGEPRAVHRRARKPVAPSDTSNSLNQENQFTNGGKP